MQSEKSYPREYAQYPIGRWPQQQKTWQRVQIERGGFAEHKILGMRSEFQDKNKVDEWNVYEE